MRYHTDNHIFFALVLLSFSVNSFCSNESVLFICVSTLCHGHSAVTPQQEHPVQGALFRLARPVVPVLVFFPLSSLVPFLVSPEGEESESPSVLMSGSSFDDVSVD